jgi:hypothetical protein
VRRISAKEAAELAAASAEVTRRQLVQRMEEAAARRARERRRNIIVASLAGVVLVVTVVVSLVYTALVRDVERERLESGKPAPDPFLSTRAGIVRYGEGRRNRCRQVAFSNEGGGFSNETVVRCADPEAANANANADDPSQMSASGRFDAVRGGFLKK